MKAEEAGERAFDVLATHRGGLTRTRWCAYAELSPSQLSRAIDWLRDLFGQEPVIRNYIGGEWIYSLAEFDRDAREHVERMLRTQITRVRREYNLLHGITQKHPGAENEYQEELARRRLADLRYAYSRIEREGQEELELSA